MGVSCREDGEILHSDVDVYIGDELVQVCCLLEYSGVMVVPGSKGGEL